MGTGGYINKIKYISIGEEEIGRIKSAKQYEYLGVKIIGNGKADEDIISKVSK